MFIRQWVIFIVGFFLALILANTPYAPVQSLPTSSSTLTNNASSVTVQLNDRPLFVLQTKGVSPSIEQRALAQQHRIEQFAKSTIPVEALHSSDIEGATLVAAEDVLLFAITDKDAQAVGKTRQILAREYIQKLQQAVNRYREERSVQSRIRASIIAILSTLGLLLILTFLNKITPQIDEWLDERRNRRIPNIQIQSLELVSSSQLSACLKILTKLFRRVLTLAAIFGYLALVLSLFPATRKLGKTLWSLLLSNLQRFGQAFINYLPNLMSIVLIIIIAHYLIRFSHFFFSALSREVFTLPGFYPGMGTANSSLADLFHNCSGLC